LAAPLGHSGKASGGKPLAARAGERAGGVQARTAPPKEQPPRNLSGLGTARAGTGTLESGRAAEESAGRPTEGVSGGAVQEPVTRESSQVP